MIWEFPKCRRRLDLTVRNTGNATAFDIKMKLTPAMPNPNGSKPEDVTQTLKEISLLPPDQALQLQGVLGPEVFGKVYEVILSWSQRPGDEKRESVKYTFTPTDGFRGGWNTKSLHDVSNELEKLRNEMKARK